MISRSLQCFLLWLVAAMEGNALRADRRQRDVKIVSKSDLYENKTSLKSLVNELTITGDPSELLAITKYLITAFKSHQSYTKTVCEGDTMTLNCLPGQGIKILDAFWGRNTEEICDDKPNEPANLSCPSPAQTLTEMEKRCDQKEICAVPASSEAFTNPCLNTFKYLKVSYMCLEETLQTAIGCDHDEVKISSPKGKLIKVNSALYGRMGQEACNRQGMRTVSLTCQTDLANTTHFATSRCDGKSKCAIHTIHDALANVGDPCYMVVKYMVVKYKCL